MFKWSFQLSVLFSVLVILIMWFIIVRGLDLTGLVHYRDDPQPLYDLFAISNHFGGMGGGHCKFSSSQWHLVIQTSCFSC